ncbi:MarR family winged helix-turn-helix transcriptional regulator [Streptomyces yaizuensis]|uniref:MarR family winged helix-turn-helix transcriptional regulator n=1 Tax=Streptomyces yaizuensis TaxID=2989713 RepID=UPI002B1FAE95|nr:MarR family transcriptional regulator [Streptomyces sp. YSPA8]
MDAIARQWNAVRPDLDTVPMTAYGRIYRISRAMGDRVEKEYREYGINRGEFDVLATLRRSGDPYTLSPSRLSATLMLTTGGMTGRLDRLERAGLLTRNPDPHDRRGLRITLTERGLGLVDEAVTAGVRVQSAVLGSALTPAEADELNALLRKVLSAHE